MKFDVHTIPHFDRKFKKLAKKYKSLLKDLESFLEELKANPYVGADLGSGIRKIRMAISDKGKGKSHGARVITYTVEIDEENGRVTLLTLYDKSEMVSISKQDIAELLNEI